MKGTNCICTNEKDYVMAEGEHADSSSEGKSDQLSYSYSCVQSFRKNQHIIGDLASHNSQQEYQGAAHQPALYSLSGLRNRPICQPFYYSTVSEKSSGSEEEHLYDQTQKQRAVEKDKDLTSESQQQFPVKDSLVQWLKHQFKQVNSLWSTTISKDIFIPKLFKKNQNIKMEMTLNSVDEETKNRLIEKIAKFNLGFEEHCNLCSRNETVFEVDVTSIMDDPKRLQSFLTFLKSIDSEKSKVSNKNVNTCLNDYVAVENTLEKTNIEEKQHKEKEIAYQTKNFKKLATLEKNIHLTHSATSIKSSESFEAMQKQTTLKQKEKTIVELKVIYPNCGICKAMKDTNQNICNREVKPVILPNCETIKSKEMIQGKIKSRQMTTLSRKTYSNERPKPKFEQNNEFLLPRKTHFEQNVFNVQTNIANNDNISHVPTKVEREPSCKCLMHHIREDFYRYKNQCLYGKGDEINNSFIRYVNQREYKPETFHFNENQLNSLPDEIKEDESYERFNLATTYDRPVKKTCLDNDFKKNYSEDFKSESLKPTRDLNIHKGAPFNKVLNPQDQNTANFKDNFCLTEYSSITTDDTAVKDEDLKVIATNACFKSLNYCLDSLSITNNTRTPDERENTREEDKFYFSNKYKSFRLLQEGTSNVLQTTSFKPIATHRNTGTGDKAMRTQKSFSSSHNYDSDIGNRRSLLKNATGSNVNELIKLINSENVEYKSNLIMNNEKEAQECKCSENYITDSDVGNSEKLYYLINNTCVCNDFNKSSRPLTATQTDFNGNNKIYPQTDENKCSILGCESEKCMKHKAKIKNIVFKVGASSNGLKVRPSPSSTKGNSKRKPVKPKEVCKKISSVIKGNNASNEKCSHVIWNNEKADNTINYSSTGLKSFTNKSNTTSSSWVNCEGYSSFVDSLTNRSKNNTLTLNSENLESSMIENSLGILLSELRSQRREIEYMKTLLGSKIT